MKDFTALTVDTTPKLSTDDALFATSANVEHSGKVAPSRKVTPSAILLLQLRISVTSTAGSPWCLTNETIISNNKESGHSAGPSPFSLGPKKSEQRRRLESATAAWAAIGCQFQERNRLT